MRGSGKTNLAWALLTHEKSRFLLSVSGVAFAVLLMFAEIGFLNGVLDGQILLLKKFNADLVMVSKLKTDCYELHPFSRARLLQAASVKGVKTVYPVYMDWLTLKNASKRRAICALAYNTSSPALMLQDADRYRKKMEYPWTALIDTTARQSVYGELRPGMSVELNGRKSDIIGTFSLFPNYKTDAHLIMSDANFFRLFPARQDGSSRLEAVEYGLIRINSDADLRSVAAVLKKELPDDVKVMTKPEIIRQTREHWMKRQPVVEVFGLGTVIGFVIGIIICYQILFTDITDNQAELAALKAIGYPNRYLTTLVMREGVYLSFLAFLPGLVGSFLFYYVLESISGIRMQLTVTRILAVFVLTVTMCLISAVIAIRKVMRSDPAEVF